MLDQQGDIAGPLVQRRNIDSEYIQTIVQVGAKIALCGFFAQVFMRGDDNAHIRWNNALASNTYDGARFDGSQQCCLQVERHIADFIKEERSTVSLLELAGTSLAVCAG